MVYCGYLCKIISENVTGNQHRQEISRGLSMGNYKQSNIYLLTGNTSVQKNYSPDGQLPIVKMMAQPTKLVAPGNAICLALM